MKTLFTSEASSKGGRSGTVKSPDGLMEIRLGNPLEAGIETRGPNPEMLFASAYAACYHGALINAAERLGTPINDSTARAMVSLLEDEDGGYGISVELHARLPGMEPEQAVQIMEQAHQTCPYSKALRGDAAVTLIVDKSLSAPDSTQEKNLGKDTKVIEELPAQTQELTALMDASEKTSGQERAAVTKSIRDQAK